MVYVHAVLRSEIDSNGETKQLYRFALICYVKYLEPCTTTSVQRNRLSMGGWGGRQVREMQM